MARNRKDTLSIQDRFADALARTAGTDHDGNVPFAGRELGLDTQASNNVMQRLRKAMGAQAR